VQNQVVPRSVQIDMAASSLRTCRVCQEQKPLSEFHMGPSGRLKSICSDCVDVLTFTHYGAGLRRCATCGKPTANYRCSKCWAVIRNGETNFSGLDPNYLP
jgi:predicted amidophosphoribosyltransferase